MLSTYTVEGYGQAAPCTKPGMPMACRLPADSVVVNAPAETGPALVTVIV